MMLSRVLGGIGRVFISTGVLTLLFVAYQLWGTGFLEARAQGQLEDEFASIFEEAEALREELPASSGGDVPSGEPVSTDPADPTSEEDPSTVNGVTNYDDIDQRLIDLVWKPEGSSVAQILIPDIGVSKFIIEGVGVEDLQQAPGHYPTTPMPGMPGNASIAGHRTTYGAPFGDIDLLEPGDEITVRTAQGIFTYAVIEQESGKGHFIVSPDRVDVLDQDFEQHPNRLTLTACHPKYTARQRIIVVAELIGEPAQFIPRPDDLDKLRNPDEAGGGLASEGTGGDDGENQLGANEGETGGDLEIPQEDIDAALEDGEPREPAPDPETDPEEQPVPTEPPASAEQEVDDQAAVAVAFDDEESFGEGLNGDSDAVMPAVLWGVAAAAIALAAWFVGSRWKKWPSYALGAVPFAVVLFICFVYIDKALPSY